MPYKHGATPRDKAITALFARFTAALKRLLGR